MLKIPGLKIIRVYGDRREQAEFPIPNKRQPLKQSTDDETQILNEDNELKAVSLHHVIRKFPCPFSAELGKYERKFDEDRRKHLRTSDIEVEEYCEVRMKFRPNARQGVTQWFKGAGFEIWRFQVQIFHPTAL